MVLLYHGAMRIAPCCLQGSLSNECLWLVYYCITASSGWCLCTISLPLLDTLCFGVRWLGGEVGRLQRGGLKDGLRSRHQGDVGLFLVCFGERSAILVAAIYYVSVTSNEWRFVGQEGVCGKTFIHLHPQKQGGGVATWPMDR